MSKKTWIIGGAVVVALIGATVIGRNLTGAKKAKSDSGKVTTLKVAHTKASHCGHTATMGGFHLTPHPPYPFPPCAT